tara:strand:- start:1853 stop:2371 length:519 start_codon:yes stop_codon:yes gene_type:complete
MANRIDLKKEIYLKSEYEQVINTKFTSLGVSSVNEDIEIEDNVSVFFEQYNTLFYDIPAEGETNSHDFLVKTSGEYINFDANLEEIEALRTEITELRKEILQLQIENANLISGGSLNSNIDLDGVISTASIADLSAIENEAEETQANIPTSFASIGNNNQNLVNYDDNTTSY